MSAAVLAVAAGSVSMIVILTATLTPADAADAPSGSSRAVRPTAGFPPAPTPFTVQIAVRGRPECLDRSPDATLRLRACDRSSASQRWTQQTLDSEDFGLVFDPAGDCIVQAHGRAVTAPPNQCDPTAQNASNSWKQLPDGTITGSEPAPGQYLPDYWKVDARTGTFTIAAGPHDAGEFAVVPLRASS